MLLYKLRIYYNSIMAHLIEYKRNFKEKQDQSHIVFNRSWVLDILINLTCRP